MFCPRRAQQSPGRDTTPGNSPLNTRVLNTALVDLGLRLQHYIAARGKDPDQVADTVCLSRTDFALVLTGHHDLPFSALHAVLDALDIEWWQFFGSDMIHHPRIHHLTVDSDVWHAIDAGLQTFDVRQDGTIFCAGDYLYLHEKLESTGTAKVLLVQVRYILHAGRSDGPHGYVIMALRHHDGPIPPRA